MASTGTVYNTGFIYSLQQSDSVITIPSVSQIDSLGSTTSSVAFMTALTTAYSVGSITATYTNPGLTASNALTPSPLSSGTIPSCLIVQDLSPTYPLS